MSVIGGEGSLSGNVFRRLFWRTLALMTQCCQTGRRQGLTSEASIIGHHDISEPEFKAELVETSEASEFKQITRDVYAWINKAK